MMRVRYIRRLNYSWLTTCVDDILFEEEVKMKLIFFCENINLC